MKAPSKVKAPEKRGTLSTQKGSRIAAGRLSAYDYAALCALATQEGVGVSTLTRLILEKYIEEYPPTRRGAKKKLTRVGRFAKVKS